VSGGVAEAQPRLRPAGEGDRDFLLAVYASTREDELAPMPWSDEQRRAFVAFQFDAQDAAYRAYPDATFSVVEVGGVPAGRLYVARWAEEIRIVDVALLPAFRGRGVGGALLSALCREADASGRRLTIHVEAENRARRLYERMGFRVVEAVGPVYLLLERSAS
jgi:ribosomal protein S18 acetylase RimI-like enzyme